jgi:regulatory protein
VRGTALEAATAALARRDHSAAGLVAYLERRGAGAEDARAAVARLADAGYVDDERFAVGRAEVLAARGYGDEGIRFELEQEGVAREHVEAALAAVPPERERALGLLRGGARGLDAACRRLAAKGFPADAVEAARAAVRRDEDGDDA